eukprot:922732-Amorphochlora_amoeboformis.AAC.1
MTSQGPSALDPKCGYSELHESHMSEAIRPSRTPAPLPILRENLLQRLPNDRAGSKAEKPALQSQRLRGCQDLPRVRSPSRDENDTPFFQRDIDGAEP